MYDEAVREIAATTAGDTIGIFGSWVDRPGNWAYDSVARNSDLSGANAREPWGEETSVAKEKVNTDALNQYA